MQFPRVLAVLAAAVCAAVLRAQTPAEDPEVIRAAENIEKLRALVNAGAAPRALLEKAEESIADAQDEALLRKTIYGQDLTADQTVPMTDAARRRLERRERKLAEARKLADAGALARRSLTAYEEDVTRARTECELAALRADAIQQAARAAEIEEQLAIKLAQAPSEAPAIAERFDGDGVLPAGAFPRIEQAFEDRFGKPLPVSAMGETAVHRSLGFDHRGRIDVALHPDTPEGSWLLHYLTAQHIPYFAFRQAVPGKATGAHIHLGPMSTRLVPGG